MRALYVVAIALAGLGIGAFLTVIFSVKPQDIMKILGQIGTTIQGGAGQVAAWWTSLPDLFKTLIAAGIPITFSIFLAWTKNRAIQKVQQVERQAQRDIGGLQEQLSTMTDMSNENQLLKAKLDRLQNSGVLSEATSQVSTLRTSNLQLQNQIQTMITEHIAEVRALNNTIEQLKMAERVVIK